MTAIASWQLPKKENSGKSTGCLHAAWRHCCGIAIGGKGNWWHLKCYVGGNSNDNSKLEMRGKFQSINIITTKKKWMQHFVISLNFIFIFSLQFQILSPSILGTGILCRYPWYFKFTGQFGLQISEDNHQPSLPSLSTTSPSLPSLSLPSALLPLPSLPSSWLPLLLLPLLTLIGF